MNVFDAIDARVLGNIQFYFKMYSKEEQEYIREFSSKTMIKDGKSTIHEYLDDLKLKKKNCRESDDKSGFTTYAERHLKGCLQLFRLSAKNLFELVKKENQQSSDQTIYVSMGIRWGIMMPPGTLLMHFKIDETEIPVFSSFSGVESQPYFTAEEIVLLDLELEDLLRGVTGLILDDMRKLLIIKAGIGGRVVKCQKKTHMNN